MFVSFTTSIKTFNYGILCSMRLQNVKSTLTSTRRSLYIFWEKFLDRVKTDGQTDRGRIYMNSTVDVVSEYIKAYGVKDAYVRRYVAIFWTKLIII